MKCHYYDWDNAEGCPTDCNRTDVVYHPEYGYICPKHLAEEMRERRKEIQNNANETGPIRCEHTFPDPSTTRPNLCSSTDNVLYVNGIGYRCLEHILAERGGAQ